MSSVRDVVEERASGHRAPELLWSSFLAGREGRPRSGFHIAQNGFFPVVLRMLLQKIFGYKILAAGMSCAGAKTHVRRQAAVGNLALHRAARIVGIPIPLGNA